MKNFPPVTNCRFFLFFSFFTVKKYLYYTVILLPFGEYPPESVDGFPATF